MREMVYRSAEDPTGNLRSSSNETPATNQLKKRTHLKVEDTRIGTWNVENNVRTMQKTGEAREHQRKYEKDFNKHHGTQ